MAWCVRRDGAAAMVHARQRGARAPECAPVAKPQRELPAGFLALHATTTAERRTVNHRLASIALALATLGACSADDSLPGVAAAAAAQPASQNGGKVLQVLHGGGYTYAEVQTGSGDKVWVAGQQIEVKPGKDLQWGNFMVMREFNSRSLGRTFDEIVFVESWGASGAQPVATAPHGSLPAAQLGSAAPAAGPTASGVVKSVQNAGGYSYIEVDRGGGQVIWVAAVETPMKAGDKLQWQGTEMSNFTARSIGRTFDKIVFAQGVTVGR